MLNHKKNRLIILLIMMCFIAVIGNCKKRDDDSQKMNKEQLNNQIRSSQNPVKLIFIHHSVGGEWLSHEYGGLVDELNKNNYYVNDITYGWEPLQLSDSLFKKIKRKFWGWLGWDKSGAYNIGNRTDIGHWYEWFAGPDSNIIMNAVYQENAETDMFGDHRNLSSKSPLKNPGLNTENEIIMIKSCYPNTMLSGKVSDKPTTGNNPPRAFNADSKDHTVANAKRIYNDILNYFEIRQDRFFVIVTAPPMMELPKKGSIARGFSNWLYYDWLKENNYEHKNVFVFDLFNVLTSGEDWKTNDIGDENGNHHRAWKGKEQHVFNQAGDVLVYPRNGNNNHPSAEGLQKATDEFVDLLNLHYNHWRSGKIE